MYISPHLSLSGRALRSDSQRGVANWNDSSVMNACAEAPEHCLICRFCSLFVAFFFFYWNVCTADTLVSVIPNLICVSGSFLNKDTSVRLNVQMDY